MNFDVQAAFNVVLGVGCVLMGAILKTIWDAVQDLKQDINKIEVHLPTNYVAKDEFRLALQEIKDLLGKIFDKLDGKVDR